MPRGRGSSTGDRPPGDICRLGAAGSLRKNCRPGPTLSPFLVSSSAADRWFLRQWRLRSRSSRSIGEGRLTILISVARPAPSQRPRDLVHDLEKTIVALATDRDRSQRMGQAGCARVKSEYAWPVKIKQLVMIYREVLDPSGETATGKS